MRPTEDIERLIKKSNVQTSAETDKKILGDALEGLERLKQTGLARTRLSIWRIIMKSSVTKLAVAAVIIIAAMLGIHYFCGSIDGVTVAWATITRRIGQINYAHFYQLESDKDGFRAAYEGWFAHGKVLSRGDSGYLYYDDGEILQGFDLHKTRTVVHRSGLAGGRTFFEAVSRGLLSSGNKQFGQQVPVSVGDDFLIYKFGPPKEDADWIDSMSVTVGKNSLLPVQIKTYHKKSECTEKDYELVVFDYEEPEKPKEFFEPPTAIAQPHGRGEVMLDGKEVEINISDSPGIKKAVVRLYNKYDGPSEAIPMPLRDRYEIEGGPVFSLDVAFITEEGFRSITNNKILVWLNQGTKCGAGADNWPDGKYRNIRFTPVLKATDRKDVYIVEISCWLRTKNSDS